MKTTVKTISGLPRVAIVGRPNVGKSSLFNRIIRMRKAIVYQEVGTTRDRISQITSFDDKNFIVTDTGGFIPRDESRILKLVKEQIKSAIDESDMLLFVCDGQTGLTSQDMELAALIRKSNKKIFLVINKADNKTTEDAAQDFYRLGLGRPYPVSALHDLGVTGLLEDVVKEFPAGRIEEKKTEPIRVAIVGRPNVGKSSFLNCLLNEERAIVDETPGTTRDNIDTYLKDGESEFILVDTAGIRHRRKIREAVDVYSMARTKDAITRSEVCLVLIDGYAGLVADDLKILDLVLNEGKCCVLCVNKWDLVAGLPSSRYEEMIYDRAGFLKKYPVLFTSTKTRYNVYNSLKRIREVIDNASLKISTPQLNKVLSSAKSKGPLAPRANRLKLNYGTQIAIKPPTFLIFANNQQLVLEEHENFIENLFRKNFGFFGTPVKFRFRTAKDGEK